VLDPEGFEGQIQIHVGPDDPEGEAATTRGSRAVEEAPDGQIDEITARGETGGTADRDDVGEGQVGSGRREVCRGDAGGEVLPGGEASSHDGGATVDAEQAPAAPLDAQREELGAVEQLEPRLDLDLGRQQIEVLVDGL